MRRCVLLLFVLPAALLATPSRLALGSQQENRFAAAIDESRAAVRALVTSRQAPGAGAAVAVEGQIVWQEAFGLADLEHEAPATERTRFGIGSISKTLTMAAAVKLWERGVIDLDVPVERYLPDFPHRGRGITIRRLAAHQGGISDRFAVDHYSTHRRFATLNEAYQEITTAPLEYEPGSKTAYATGLYTIIGRALESAANRDYRTLMREEVFAPAGAAGIVANDRRAIVPHRTGFYVAAAGGGFEHGPFFDPSHKLPGAGYLATAGDIARVGASLLQGRLLTARGHQEMFRTVPLGDGTPTSYGLGLQVDESGKIWYLAGGGIGISALLAIHPEQDLVVALLANTTGAPVGGAVYDRVAAAFARALERR